jgi:hypothetical protein
MGIALVRHRSPTSCEVDRPRLVTGALDVRRTVLSRQTGHRTRAIRRQQMEVVERRVIVELEPVGALRQGLSVELLAVVPQVDRKVVVDLGRQDGEVVLRQAELPGRILLPDPKQVVPAALAHDVHVAARVLAERGRELHRDVRLFAVVRRVRNPEHVRPDLAGAVVGVDVPAEQALNLLVTAHVAARDRARADVVVVLVDRRGVVRRLGAVPVQVPRLHAAPAEVDASSPPDVDRPVVDLLPDVLPHIAEREVPFRTIEREAPGVADAEGPDLRLPRRLAYERVVGRHRVRVHPVLARVDAQDLAAQVLEVLA